MEPRAHELGPNETAAGHPITDTENYRSDIALLNYLLQDLRVLVRRAERGELQLTPQQVITWEVHGLRRRTVICDPVGLQARRDVEVVGFFGDRRSMADETDLDRSEVDLIGEFVNYPGILSYSSVELIDDYWANLVVHTAPGDREAWRASEIHKDAVDRVAPVVYHGVRIHNGCIRNGVIGPETVVLECTKYWDYDVTPTWHAVRTLPGGESEVLEGPVEVPG